MEGKKDWSIQRNDYAADSPVITDLIFTGVASAEPTLILFSLVAEDNSVTQYQVTVEVAEEDKPSAGVITGTDENAGLVSALAGLGIGTKDEDGNLHLTQAEIDATTTLDLSGKGLNTLEGLEVFGNLTQLSCSGNQIAELDLAKLPRLTYLDCSGNLLKGLDLSQTPDLTYLNCSGNTLATADFSCLANLEELLCNNCFGSSNAESRASIENGVLDLSRNTKLRNVQCSGNGLTGLVLPDVPNLSGLYCTGNYLASLDISGQTDLIVLDVSDNVLTALDVSACKEELRVLNCGGNALKELDVTLCANLQTLDCHGNRMTSLNAFHNVSLNLLRCGDQQNGQQLNLILPETLMDSWETTWKSLPENANVVISDGTFEPGVSGEDFGNGGIY